MSVNYTQYCILGFSIKSSALKVISSPAIYRSEPRFDTKTGKQTHEEQILVKQEHYIYRFKDIESDCILDLCNTIAFKYDVNASYNNDTIYIGFFIGENYGDRVELLDGEISIEEINEISQELVNIFPNQEMSLYFIGEIG